MTTAVTIESTRLVVCEMSGRIHAPYVPRDSAGSDVLNAYANGTAVYSAHTTAHFAYMCEIAALERAGGGCVGDGYSACSIC